MSQGSGKENPMFGDSVGNLYAMRLPDGTTAIVDEILKEFTESAAPRPSQTSLDAVWDRTLVVRLFDGGMLEGEPLRRDLIASFTGHELTDLRRLTQLADHHRFHCMCLGSQTLELSDAEDTVLAVIGLHHGTSIRWDAWNSDAVLKDGRALAGWLALHAAKGPLNELLESERMRLEEERLEADWLASMPDCLAAMSARFLQSTRTGDGEVALAAEAGRRLAHVYVNEVERAGLLLRWFGAGTGSCSGYPVHEGIPGEILMGLPTERIVEFLQAEAPAESQWIGALRFFSGVGSKSMKLVPPSVRDSLLETARRFGDGDNLERVQKRFADADLA